MDAHRIAVRKALGSRLRASRLAAGYRSQARLAAALHVSRETVQRAETGEVSPRGETLIAWARVCGVSLDRLLAGDDAEAAQ